ncbi:MAG TPA: alpha/beta hydrolase, partial [Bdellovibrionota bacterium]|nr:alpha/beta hydrolase [Bdellovibrionota bacterium]
MPIKLRPQGARKPGRSQAPQPTDSVTHGYVKAADGTRLFYSIEGRGKPIVFCYGLVCSSLHWTYQIEHFSRGYQSIWFDYRGHQNSDLPKDITSITLPTIAQDLETLLDELGVKDAVFLGHSMGVNVVLEFYKRCPERVAGMVLANGTAKRPLENLFRHNAFATAFTLLQKAYRRSPELVSLVWKLQKGNPIARSLITLGGFNPHLTPQADIELYVDQVAELDPAVMVQLIDSYGKYDATSWLHKVDVPTLLLAGERDFITPLDQQELMAQLIPNARLEIVRHGSHCPQMDLPDFVNSKIEGYLAEIG